MQVIDPRGRQAAAGVVVEDWRVDARGQTVGVLWNGKPNADAYFREIARRLRHTFGVADVVWANKSEDAQGPGRPATEEIFQRLTSGTIAVLSGSGD